MSTDIRSTHSPDPAALPFEHGYAALPERFFQRIAPTPVAAPRWLAFNAALADELGIEGTLDNDAGLALLAGNHVPTTAMPLAMAYAGHQFGGFVPQLGDGRAILLGELIDVHGARRDLQLKGSGPTRFSRGGDGRAAMGPVLREFVISEAMHALGIPTTRSLAAVASGERVWRERGAVPGAVLARVAASHLRVGTFAYFAARDDADGLRTLVDYAIARHFPALGSSTMPAFALLEAVIERQARLVAQWMQVGFVHGVMNTDNMTISGETIDYGPCAFLDEYAPDKTFSSIDRQGRYAFANQAPVAQWNLARLAECLLPLIGESLRSREDPDIEAATESAVGALERFPALFEQAWLGGMRRKLGLGDEQAGDEALVHDLLAAMHAAGADWTLTFRRLCDESDPAITDSSPDRAPLPRDPVAPRAFLDDWLPRWRQRLAADTRSIVDRTIAMRAVNPAVIARNHLVEAALAAAENEDMRPFESLLAAVRRPFDDGVAQAAFMPPPAPAARVTQTFCGT
jgi:uncharacterized protein YdiU (UPF0061 family)